MGNKYEMNDEQTERSYVVQDDQAINKAGFSDKTREEQELIAERDKYSTKNSVACLLLSLIHCHYFYVGRVGRGLLCLCTANFLYIGFIIDFFMIGAGKFKDKQGRYVNTGRRVGAEIALDEFYRAQGVQS
jgi:TM2 domain-containing membrane protein YozV